MRRLFSSIFLLVVLLTLQNTSFAQSVLLDDAHTSTAPKSTDSNFGTNPNLFVNAAGNVYLKFKLSSHATCGSNLTTLLFSRNHIQNVCECV